MTEAEHDPPPSSPTSNNNQDAFRWDDDLCLDPHQSSLEEGRVQGRTAGELAGFHDGQTLGQTKGIEFGMELGFIRGFLNALGQLQEKKTGDEDHRIQRSMVELEKSLDDFPCPDAMFEQTPNISTDATSRDDQYDDSEDPINDKLDIIAKMQRVRARFKLLTVKLGMPHFSLKKVMDEVSSTEDTSTGGPPMDSEW